MRQLQGCSNEERGPSTPKRKCIPADIPGTFEVVPGYRTENEDSAKRRRKEGLPDKEYEVDRLESYRIKIYHSKMKIPGLRKSKLGVIQNESDSNNIGGGQGVKRLDGSRLQLFSPAKRLKLTK